MILSDRTIREELAAGRIVIDPLDEACIQPSSVDLHIDRYFRVFKNHTMSHIDVKQNLEDLTELVEIGEDDRVHAPPRRVRPGLHAASGSRSPTTSSPASRASPASAASGC